MLFSKKSLKKLNPLNWSRPVSALYLGPPKHSPMPIFTFLPPIIPPYFTPSSGNPLFSMLDSPQENPQVILHPLSGVSYT